MDRKPHFRKLRCYALDPFLSLSLDTFDIHELTYRVDWEENLEPGPSGEYIDIIDYDPTVGKFYKSVDLNEPCILVEDGLDPSESNPQFHQQMVYAVSMKTIENFEKALGRKVMWSRRILIKNGREKEQFVKRLRIYPHALREANAYYSPRKKSILFGYFQSSSKNPNAIMPKSIVFTCLSHDIITHELSHALIDGLLRHYNNPTNPDVLAFHEAFSDLIALFQHFTFPDLLKHQIAKTRGKLDEQNLLGELAVQFGSGIGSRGALRSAIGEWKDGEWVPRKPRILDYQRSEEPHTRGSILVAAVFDAFLLIYKKRIADLLRLSSGGTGVLPIGEIHPDLVNRLANEAAKASKHILNMCIRALDYCPAIDITFGEYLRAIISADYDLVKNDVMEYRVAFIEAFKKRGIYPQDLQILSVESLRWRDLNIKLELDAGVDEVYDQNNTAIDSNYGKDTNEVLRLMLLMFKKYGERIAYIMDRETRFNETQLFLYNEFKVINEKLVELLSESDNELTYQLADITGLYFSRNDDQMKEIGLAKNPDFDIPLIKVEDLHQISRVGPDGELQNFVFLTLSQRIGVKLKKERGVVLPGNSYVPKNDADEDESRFIFYGSCTLIFDLNKNLLKNAVKKPIISICSTADGQKICRNEQRINDEFAFVHGYVETHKNDFELYFGQSPKNRFQEPFALLHNH